MKIKDLPNDIQIYIYKIAISKYYFDNSKKLFELLLWNKLNENFYVLYDDWNYNIIDKELDLPLINDKKDLLEYIKNSIFIYRFGINNYNYSHYYGSWIYTETCCFKIKKYYLYITEILIDDNVEYDLYLNDTLLKRYQYKI